jgi:hypothetical protein
LENAIPGKAGPESACEEQGPAQHRTRGRRQPGNRDGEDQLAFDLLQPVRRETGVAARAFVRVSIGLVLFAAITIYSLSCAIGLYSIAKNERLGDVNAEQARYERLTRTQDEVRADLDRLNVNRAPGAIRAEIEALKHDHKYDRSRQCTNATVQSSRQLCARIRKAEVQLKDAEKAEKLRAQLRSLEASLAGLNLQKVLSRADPAAEAVARVVGQDPGTVRHALALMIAILIEAGSGFGFWIVALLGQPRVRDQGQIRVSGVDVKRPAQPDQLTAPQTLLQQWADRYIERDAASAVTAAALKAHHEAWASARGVSPANPTKIGRLMTDLGFKREKVKGRNRYAGARLVERESSPRLAVDNAGRPEARNHG